MNHSTYTCFDVSIDSRNVAFATLDVPDRPLNVLDRRAMEELHEIVADFEAPELSYALTWIEYDPSANPPALQMAS